MLVAKRCFSENNDDYNVDNNDERERMMPMVMQKCLRITMNVHSSFGILLHSNINND